MNHYNGNFAWIALALVVAGCGGEEETSQSAQAEPNVAQAGPLLEPESRTSCTQLVQTATLYYSDPAKTNFVGDCSITCAQWVAGTAYLSPSGGAKCQGTTTGYTLPYMEWCTGCQN
jgi:hypothetical protein